MPRSTALMPMTRVTACTALIVALTAMLSRPTMAVDVYKSCQTNLNSCEARCDKVYVTADRKQACRTRCVRSWETCVAAKQEGKATKGETQPSAPVTKVPPKVKPGGVNTPTTPPKTQLKVQPTGGVQPKTGSGGPTLRR